MKTARGIVWETSPSKFATLPFLLAANRQLLSDADMDKTVEDFCNKLFGKSAQSVYKLLQMWSDAKLLQ